MAAVSMVGDIFGSVSVQASPYGTCSYGGEACLSTSSMDLSFIGQYGWLIFFALLVIIAWLLWLLLMGRRRKRRDEDHHKVINPTA